MPVGLTLAGRSWALCCRGALLPANFTGLRQQICIFFLGVCQPFILLNEHKQRMVGSVPWTDLGLGPASGPDSSLVRSVGPLQLESMHRAAVVRS